MKAIYGFLAAGLVGTCAWAQEAKIVEGENAGVPAKTEPSASQKEIQQPKKGDGNSLIGKTVFDEKGREIGRVQDLVVDMEKGELGYAVLAVKGEGNLKLPMPASALKRGDSEEKLVLNVSEHVLAALEVYRDEELPSPDAFSIEGETAVGRPGTSEQGSGASQEGEKEKKKGDQRKVDTFRGDDPQVKAQDGAQVPPSSDAK